MISSKQRIVDITTAVIITGHREGPWLWQRGLQGSPLYERSDRAEKPVWVRKATLDFGHVEFSGIWETSPWRQGGYHGEQSGRGYSRFEGEKKPGTEAG